MSRNYRSSIPRDAVEAIEQSFATGAKHKAFYILDGEKVGFREWEVDGTLLIEYGIRNGEKHGRQYCFCPNGEPYEVTPYRNGRIHGTGIQWADDGSILITYKMVNGVGLHLWCDQFNGRLAEECYWPEDGELGYRRDWNSDDKTIYEEYFFLRGKGYHGIWREWNSNEKLRRGFPHFFVNDARVTKRQYQKATEVDSILPKHRPEDDQPHRKLPKEYLAQRKSNQY